MDKKINFRLFPILIIAHVFFLPLIYSCQAQGHNSAIALHSGENHLHCEKGKCYPLFENNLEWRFHYSGNKIPSRLIEEEQLRVIKIPGYWHEAIAGTPSTGNALYRLYFSFAENVNPDFNAIEIGEVNSAARLYLNNRFIGQVGVIGENRKEEFARLHPEIIAIPPDIWLKDNRLELVVSNFHARGGGILRIRLGDYNNFIYERQKLIMKEGFLVGVFIISGLIFFVIFLSNRQEYSFLFFSLLLILAALRSFSSNSFIEFYYPAIDLTDLRLVVEYLTAIAISPLLFFWFIYHLFPDIKKASYISPESFLTTKFLPGQLRIPTPQFFLITTAKYSLTFGGVMLSIFILFSHDASVYGYYQPQMVYFFLIPALLFFLLIFSIAIYKRQPGAIITLAGYMVLMATIVKDITTTVQGHSYELYVPLGMLFFVIALAITLALRLYHLHQEVRESRDLLIKSNQELAESNRVKDNFLINSSRALKNPLQIIVDLALTILDNPARKYIRLLIESGKELLLKYRRIEDYLIHLKNKTTGQNSFDIRTFLGTQKILLEKSHKLKVQLDIPDKLPLVFADRESLQMIMTELADNAIHHAEKKHLLIRIAHQNKKKIHICIRTYGSKRRSIQNPGAVIREFYTENAVGPGMGLGLALVQRIAENHGGSLEIKSELDKENGYTDFIFPLSVVSASLMNPDRENDELKRHIYFLEGISHNVQAQKERENLKKIKRLF